MDTRIRRLFVLVLAICVSGLAPTIDAASAAGRSAPTVRATAMTVPAAAHVPAAPFITRVSPRGLAALVAWAPNAPGDQVTGYAATAKTDSTPVPNGCGSPPVATAPATDTAVIVEGLCVGVAYRITVTAKNATGTSPPSTPSSPVAPLRAHTPSAPLITSVLNRSKAAIVSWSPPDDNGGSALTGYVLRAIGANTVVTTNASASSTHATIAGLTNGAKYIVGLQAVNAIGTSDAAGAAAAPRTSYTAGAPQDFSAVPAGSGAVTVKWSAPADNGGDPVSRYDVTYQQMVANTSGTACGKGWAPANGSTPKTASAASTQTSLTIKALAANEYFCFSIVAVTAAGSGLKATIASPVTSTVQLTSKTVVLTQSTMTALRGELGHALVWPNPPPAQIASLKVGKVVVGAPAPGAPDGILATVTSISSTSGADVINTTPAALSDALVDASFGQALNPLATAGSTIRAMVPGIRTEASPALQLSTSRTLSIDYQQNLGSAGRRLVVKGSVELSPTVEIDLTLNHGFLGIPDGATLSALGKLDAKASLTVGLNYPNLWRVEVEEIDGDPFLVDLGPIVVPVVPKIPIYLQASGEVDVGVSVTATVGASMSWSTNDPGHLSTKNLSDLTLTAGPIPGVVASGSFSLGFTAEPEIALFDVVGPDIRGDVSLTGDMNFNPEPGTPFLSIGPDIELDTGLHIDLLVWDGELNVHLATLKFRPFVINAAPEDLELSPVNATVPAGHSQTFTASRSDALVHQMQWTLDGGVQADHLVSTGPANTITLTTAAPNGRTLTLTAKDTTDPEHPIGTTTVFVGTPFDPPQNLTATLNGDSTQATVTWAAPTSTGGSPLSGYTVLTQPATSTVNLPASTTTTHISGLTPGTAYVIDVFATNTAGLRSSPATQLVQGAAGSTLGTATLNGPAVPMNVSVPGQPAIRTFTLGARAHVGVVINAVHVNAPAASNCVTVAIFDASGTSAGAGDTECAGTRLGFYTDIGPGTYTVRFQTFNATDTANGSLLLSTPRNVGTITANSAAAAMTINRAGQPVTGTFTLGARAHVGVVINAVHVNSPAVSNCVSVAIFDASGTSAGAGDTECAGTPLGFYTDIGPGTYTVRFQTFNATDTGTGSLLLSTPRNVGTITANGAAAAAMTINRAGQAVTRTFTLSASAHVGVVINAVHVNTPAANNCAAVAIFDASGNSAGAGDTECAGTPLGFYTDIGPGTYTVRFQTFNATDTGTGNLLVSTPRNVGTITANGAAAAMTINRAGQPVTRTFTLSASAHIGVVINAVHVNAPAANNCVAVALFDANGNSVGAGDTECAGTPLGLSADIGPGTYTVRFQTFNATDTANGTLKVTKK